MSRFVIRGSDLLDLADQESDLRLLGYREVRSPDLRPGEFRKLTELDDDEHRPVVILEWEDGGRSGPHRHRPI